MTSATTDSPFTFQHDGKTYKFEGDFSTVRRPKWLRANRRRDPLDLAFTMIEELAGDEALAAIDEMDEKEFEALSKRLNEAMSAGFSG